eukprot:TRINITY_DN3880_c0_g1_i2.p1 TRINITY_DN3880_c0_g1~~TRINITY_DN3880_c0_g1_i2.p1  ORF type:complete len:461 (+),score=104.73 TRINITY_DN3880_c0_g1_i2:196-1578(+)
MSLSKKAENAMCAHMQQIFRNARKARRPVDADTLRELFGKTVSYGSAKLTKILLDNGVDVNMPLMQRASAITLASGLGHEAVVRLLLERGAPVTSSDGEPPPLSLAANNGNLAIVKLLLDHGAPLEDSDITGTALTSAANMGRAETVAFLLARGANVHATMYDSPAIVCAAEKGGNGAAENSGNAAAVVKVLLANGALPNARRDRDGATALNFAARNNDVETVKVLLAHKDTDVNVMSLFSTPLWAAASNGFHTIVKLLLKRGASVMLPNGSTSNTPMIAAAINGHFEIVKTLAKHGGLYDCTLTRTLADVPPGPILDFIKQQWALVMADPLIVEVLAGKQEEWDRVTRIAKEQVIAARQVADRFDRTTRLVVERHDVLCANAGADLESGSDSAASSTDNGRGQPERDARVCATSGCNTVGRLSRCAGCQEVFYCSVECQRKSWPEHKADCRKARAQKKK